MEITLLIMENHGKIMELCFRIFVGALKLDQEGFIQSPLPRIDTAGVKLDSKPMLSK